MKITVLFGILCIAYAIANPNSSPKSRVVGDTGRGGAYQFIVSVQNKKEHICGGAIISNRAVITASSCVQNVNTEDLRIFADNVDLNEKGLRFKVKDVVKMDPSGDQLIKNNIALLRTEKEMKESGSIIHIRLPEKNDPEDGDTSTFFCGWGKSSADGEPISTVQRCVAGGTTSLSTCKEHHSEVDKLNICVRSQKDKGACGLDLGGPLFDRNTRELVGIATPALSCGTNIPDVHTRVYEYKQWIMDNYNAAISINLNHLLLWVLLIIPLLF